MEKRLRQAIKSSAAEFLSEAIVLPQKSVKNALRSAIHSISPTAELNNALGGAMESLISDSICRFPDSKEKLQVMTCLCSLILSHPKQSFPASLILPSLRLLHDNLILFESHPLLSSDVASLCEHFWKENLPGRDSLISQSLPFILSRSLALHRKADVHRAYALRQAFTLFDFDDDSIEDLKTLLIRCLISPVYLKNNQGRKFLSFVLGLSMELMKESLEMIKSQIPFGRKSAMEAYGEILFKMWKVASEEFKQEIEDGFVMGLVDGSIHARSKPFAASIRCVLGGFVSQRITEGVENLLFRLSEPIIFRSLQVANSQVRLNALHLFLDLFPLDDPDATKETKDALCEKQFYLLERLLADDCPGVRSTAVEGCCRILHLFWEILPTGNITKFLTKITDDMSHDVSNIVRLSALHGISYLIDKPQAHEILKVLIPRVSHLARDSSLTNRVAFVDLLLNATRMRSFAVEKVVGFDGLFEGLQEDDPLFARRVVRLLMKSSVTSCDSLVALMKKHSLAGARYCEFAASEGADEGLLVDILATLVRSVNGKMEAEESEAILVGCSHVCSALPDDKVKLAVSETELKSLLKVASTSNAKSSVLKMFSKVSSHVGIVSQDCMRIVVNCGGLSENAPMQSEARAALKLLISFGLFRDVLQKWTEFLQKVAYRCHVKFGVDLPASLFTQKQHKKWKATPGKKQVKFEDEFSIATGISWQISDLLESKESCSSLLSSRTIHLSLKVISEISLVQFLDACSFSAHSSLALHMAVEGDENALEETTDHLIHCVSKVLCGDCEGESRGDLLSQTKVLTAVLKFIVDAITLGFVSNLAAKCINITAFCVANMSKKIKEMGTNMNGDEQKLFLACLTRFTTYSAKLVNVTLRNCEETEAAFGLVNKMFYLIDSIEVGFDVSGALRFVSLMKKWLPDLILGLGSVFLLKQPDVECVMKLIKESYPSWIVSFAAIQEEDRNFVALTKLMEMVVSLLKGSAEVKDAVGLVLLVSAFVGLEEDGCDNVLGVVSFICLKLVSDDKKWNELPMMLGFLPRIYTLIEGEIDKREDGDVARDQLCNAKALLQPVWLFHAYETGKFSMEEQ